MEREILRQYSSIRMEIIDIERRIEQDKRTIAQMEGDTIRVKGGPGGKKSYTIKGHGVKYSRKKTLLQSKLLQREKLKSRLEKIKDDIEAYVSEIEDSETRRIISLRYIDNMTWQEVSKAMGEGWTSDACRIKHQRFMEKEERKHDNGK